MTGAESLIRRLMALEACTANEEAETLSQAADMIEALSARVQGLEAALEPFAKAAKSFDGGQWQAYESQWNDVHLRVEHLRAARAALSRKDTPEPLKQK